MSNLLETLIFDKFGAYFLLPFYYVPHAELIKCQCCPHIETSQLICCANKLTGFYMRLTLALNWLMFSLCVRLPILFRTPTYLALKST